MEGNARKRSREDFEDTAEQTSSIPNKKTKTADILTPGADLTELTGFTEMEASQAPEVRRFCADVNMTIVTRDLSMISNLKGYTRQEKGDYCTKETGTFNDVTYWRYILHHHLVDNKASKHEAREPSRSIEAAIDNFLDPKPEKDLVVYTMAKLRIDPNFKVPARDQDYWAELVRMAHRKLWEEKSTWATCRNALMKRSKWSKEYQETFATCLKSYKPKIPNLLHQVDREEVAEKNGLLEKTPDGVVVLVVDKHHEILLAAFPDKFGLDFVMHAGFAKRLNRACQKFSMIRPPKRPDGGRHPLQDEWVKSRPQFSGEGDNLQSGLYHMGIWNAEGQESLLWSSDCAENHALNAKLFDGAMRAKDKALIPLLRSIAPDMFLGCTRVSKFARKKADLKNISLPMADDSPFTMTALLINLHTTPHYDLKDWCRGLACITTAGEDVTNNDLIVRALGLQIPMPSGAVVFLRGVELRHSITKWDGKSKSSIVNFIGNKVKIEAQKVAPKIMLKIRDRRPKIMLRIKSRKKEMAGSEGDKDVV